jgi:addiction module HigA family antidote
MRRGPLSLSFTVLSNVAAPSRPRRVQPNPAGVPARRPPHPGQFLESRFLKPLQISQTELAEALGVSRRRVNELINGKRAITPDTAVRLAMYFGNEAAFWMHLQVAWDMHSALRQVQASVRRP